MLERKKQRGKEKCKEEVEKAIEAGDDGLENEALKYGGEEVGEGLWQNRNKVWNGEGWPEDCLTGLVVPLVKKGEGKKREWKGKPTVDVVGTRSKVSERIKLATFLKLRCEITELFSTEDKNLFYTPCCTEPGNECSSARGSLYNYYKVVRKDLRTAGILLEDSHKLKNSADERTDQMDNSVDCSTDRNRQRYTLPQTVQSWEETHRERDKLLSRKEKNTKPVILA
ncbi:uncharacterized protein LOC117168116 [Belonocnema kinseyi]|uniref:uncharacterized protein LOC117168116 n=1 Tax=Belonocnema kinseyi TaxID=2817044 RepID=UPI00143D5569|nr:uncharacterized protein LOC117168116 [Belonocnema kinseyi]